MQKVSLEGMRESSPSSRGVLRNWHRFKTAGALFLLDVISGSVHELDEIGWSFFGIFESENTVLELDKFIKDYGEETAVELIDEINSLLENGSLSYPDDDDVSCDFDEKRNIKAMCLHIAHDCNMRCKYCFAGTGGFGGAREFMSKEVGRAALDFLVKNSGGIKHLEIDFFGGEPLMNMSVVKDIVEYGRELELKHNKILKFTMTTNALALDEEVTKFLNDFDIATVISIDGRKEVHDNFRRSVDGQGTFDTILANSLNFVDSRRGKEYYIRGTYTKNNLDFSDDVLFLRDKGFDRISFEPVVAKSELPYALTKDELNELESEYEKLLKAMLKGEEEGKPFSFFHFDMDVAKGPCLAKRLSGCGAGAEYVAIAPNGDIYPCHQFVSDESFILGHVSSGLKEESKRSEFCKTNIYKKENCQNCWTRFYCSGGCHANAWQFNSDISKPYDLGCRITRIRIEAALAYQALKRR